MQCYQLHNCPFVAASISTSAGGEMGKKKMERMREIKTGGRRDKREVDEGRKEG